MASAKFKPGECVLALTKGGTLHYEAKIIKVKKSGGKKLYEVHYVGWNKKHDAWLPLSSLQEATEENRKIAKERVQKATKEQKKKSSTKRSRQTTVNKTKTSRRRKETEPASSSKVVHEIKLKLPFNLKKKLVMDWENIQKQQLVPIPRQPSVDQILQEFASSSTNSTGTSDKHRQELSVGLEKYFNLTLPSILLYQFERHQYEDAVAKDRRRKSSEIYGVEHLLRLFVKLPMLLAQEKMDQADKMKIEAQLTDLLKFLQRKHKEYFLNEYQAASEDYIGRVRESSQ